MKKKYSPKSIPAQPVDQPPEVMQPSAEDHLKQQLEETNQKWLRAVADYHNLERRMEQEKQEWVKYANTHLLTKVIGVMDDLNRAAQFIQDPGLEMVRKHLLEVLKEFGVVELETIGKAFDPASMECLDQVEGEANIIIKEDQKGYQLHQKVLRPAKVLVGNGQVKK